MHSRLQLLVVAGCFVATILPCSTRAQEFSFECAPMPTCGKVCKLVCETKKLSAVCYGCECDEICIPGPSRPGCKHCATCGEPFGAECGPGCTGCQGHAPACKFCWRDWFACGCARPRTVKVLTKYQGEKEIGWYHWEVVDVACCGGTADSTQPVSQRCVYKPAPVDAELGDVLAVSDEELAELASVLRPDDAPSRHLADPPTATTGDDSVASAGESKWASLAERLGRFFKR